MFEYKIPRFAELRIFTREILFSMRDLLWKEQQLAYTDYSSGIITGCGLVEKDGLIGVEPGIVKFGGRLYLLEKQELLPYQPSDQWTVLKIRFGTPIASKDFEYYTGELVLDPETRLHANELEMGRFKLKTGAYLRTDYVDFADMDTEYDTVSLIHAVQAACGEPTLHRKILEQFAREAWPYLQDGFDVDFCGHCLAGRQPVRREYLTRYICRRLEAEYHPMGNRELYEALTRILRTIKGGGAADSRHRPAEDTILLV